MKRDKIREMENEVKDVYVLDSLCQMRDMDKDRLYKGRVTRVENMVLL